LPQVSSEELSPSASAAAATGVQVERPIGSVERAPLGYLEYLPLGYGDGEPRPLLVFLHGAGEAGNGSEEALALVDDLGIPQLAADGDWPDDRPFVVLSPQYGVILAQNRCDVGDDIAEFLDFAVEHYDVDPARVYLTGISCGAIGVWDYIAVHGDEEVVAAAVPISGHLEWALEKVGDDCGRLGEMPVWAFHGAKDDVVPIDFMQESWDEVVECYRPDWTLTVYPDADHIGPIAQTYDLSAGHDIYAWMLEHTTDD
jgi:predicted peptidase